MGAHRRIAVELSLILAIAWLGTVRTQGTRSALEGYVASHQRAIVSELVALLSIPNVAADTENIRRNATLNDRIEIVRTMWRMAYADGRLTEYENYLVRKLADLLGLEHHVMIEAKVEVLKELGINLP